MAEDYVEKARWFATFKHEGQQRKNGLPYITHPEAVAKILAEVAAGSKDSCALQVDGYLHDVVEDTDTSLKEISRYFGEEVASDVLELSSAPFAVDYYGKEWYLAGHMLLMTPKPLTTKLADRLHNLSDMEKVYTPEKKLRKVNETLVILDALKNVPLDAPQQKLMEMIYGITSQYPDAKIPVKWGRRATDKIDGVQDANYEHSGFAGRRVTDKAAGMWERD